MKRFHFLVALGAIVTAAVVWAASGTIVTWTGMGSRRNTVEFTIESSSIGSAANLLPGTNNANSLGSSSYRFKDVQTYDATIADDLTVTDELNVLNLIIPTVDITVTTPTVVGKLVKTAAYVVYIGTNTTDLNGWVKVGGQ